MSMETKLKIYNDGNTVTLPTIRHLSNRIKLRGLVSVLA